MKTNSPENHASELGCEEIYDPTHLPQEERNIIRRMAEAKQVGADAVDDDPIARGLVNGYIMQTIGESIEESGYDESKNEVNPQPERTLLPEQKEQLLNILKIRFEANMKRHKGIKWAKVEAKLKEASPEKLWSLNEMQKAGHEPDVYRADDEGFDVGTCCKDSPIKHRDIVYNAQAAKWLRENHPDRKFNGSAVELAEAMGIELMNDSQYKHLQKKGEYDENTWSWLTPLTGKPDLASCGARTDNRVRVTQVSVTRYHDYWAFRGSLRI